MHVEVPKAEEIIYNVISNSKREMLIGIKLEALIRCLSIERADLAHRYRILV